MLPFRKGNEERIVSFQQDVVNALSQYLVPRGLDPDPEYEHNRTTYLIRQAIDDVAQCAPWSPMAQRAVDPKVGIAAGTLYDQLKKFFTECAQVLAISDHQSAERLPAGMPLDVVQQNIGHASLDTTTGYTTSEERRRIQAMQEWEEKRARRVILPEKEGV